MMMAAGVMTMSANAQLIFTQYYEGTGNNKYVEIKNIGTSSIDLSTFTLSLWTNDSREGWKTATGTATTVTSLSGILNSGGVIVFGNPSAAAPVYAADIAVDVLAVGFNGDDSLVLWSGAIYSTSSIVDALSFSSNSGANTSFTRISTNIGYDLTAGTSILDYSSVWQQITMESVDDALAGTNARLGYSSLSPIPEPSTYALLALGGAFIVLARRRKSVAG